jgi:hypothetical protein
MSQYFKTLTSVSGVLDVVDFKCDSIDVKGTLLLHDICG